MADLLEITNLIGAPVFFVYSLTNKGGLKKGEVYKLRAVTSQGKIVVEGNPYAFKMEDFCAAIPIITAENDNTKKTPA